MLPASEQANQFVKARRLGKWYRTRADGSPDGITHTLQNGGVLVVPEGDLPRLHEALGADLATDPQCRFYVSEKNTPVFPMYYDVDMKNEGGDPDNTTEAQRREKRREAYTHLVRLAREDARNFFRGAGGAAAERLYDLIVCTTGDDFTGVHLYFPNMLVDVDRARVIRYSLVARLQHEARDVVANWENVIDDAVYGKGLRMPGSLKLADCRKCKADKGVPDPECENLCDRRGRECIGRRYSFYALFSDVEGEATDSHRAALATNWTHLIKETSVRRPAATAATAGFAEYPGCPRPTQSKLRFPKKNELPRSSPAWPLIERAVRRFAGEYYHLDVDRVLIPADNRYVMVFVSGKNARFCPNKGDYHASSRVWFKIVQSGIELRCLCKKKDRTCAQYRSHTLPLDRELVDELFPNNMFMRRARAASAASAPTTPRPATSCTTPLQMLQGMHQACTAPETPVPGYGDANAMHALPNKLRRTSDGPNAACLSLVQNLTSHLKVIEQQQAPRKRAAPRKGK